MKKMGAYCKAYPIERFREFQAWAANASEPADLTFLYLQENFSVTGDIFIDEQVVFDDVTPEWLEFCKDSLEFEIPSNGRISGAAMAGSDPRP